jgi:hypothetical protein
MRVWLAARLQQADGVESSPAITAAEDDHSKCRFVQETRNGNRHGRFAGTAHP